MAFTQCLNTLSTIVSSAGKYYIQFRTRSGQAKTRMSTIVSLTGNFCIQFRPGSGPAKLHDKSRPPNECVTEK